MDGLEGPIQSQVEGPCVKRPCAPQHPSELAHGALLPVRALAVEQEGDCEVQQRIAEEFETLIIADGPGRGVRECLPEQVGILEPIAQTVLQITRMILAPRHGQFATSGGRLWLSRAWLKAD